MINKVNFNSRKPNEYKFYHIRISKDDKAVLNLFDLSLSDVKNELNEIENGCDFIVIGTIDEIDDSIRFIKETKYSGILVNISKEDVFTLNELIFVNCTDYFKNNY